MHLIRIAIVRAVYPLVRDCNDQVTTSVPSVIKNLLSILNAHVLQDIAKDNEVIVLVSELSDVSQIASVVDAIELMLSNVVLKYLDSVHIEIVA